MNPRKKVYLFMGPPGSGKGTLSHLCVSNLNWVQLSTGDLCRKHISEQTEIGKQIDFDIKSGKLVSDSLITAMVSQWFLEVLDSVDNLILDGYPRTLAQAAAFHDFLSGVSQVAELVIVRFSISDEAVIARVCGRLVCQNKNCQRVYSQVEGSSQAPKDHMICDVCHGVLGRRSDDRTTSLVQERLATYHRHEHELLSFYKNRGYEVKDFAVHKQLSEVFDDFKKLIGLAAV